MSSFEFRMSKRKQVIIMAKIPLITLEILLLISTLRDSARPLPLSDIMAEAIQAIEEFYRSGDLEPGPVTSENATAPLLQHVDSSTWQSPIKAETELQAKPVPQLKSTLVTSMGVKPGQWRRNFRSRPRHLKLQGKSRREAKKPKYRANKRPPPPPAIPDNSSLVDLSTTQLPSNGTEEAVNVTTPMPMPPKKKKPKYKAKKPKSKVLTTTTASKEEASSATVESVDPTQVTMTVTPGTEQPLSTSLQPSVLAAARRKPKPKAKARWKPKPKPKPIASTESTPSTPMTPPATEAAAVSGTGRSWWWSNEGNSYWIPPSLLPSLYLFKPNTGSPGTIQTTTFTTGTLTEVSRGQESAPTLLFLIASLLLIPFCTTLGRLMEGTPTRSFLANFIKIFVIAGAMVMVLIAVSLETSSGVPKVTEMLTTFSGMLWIGLSLSSFLFTLLTPCRARCFGRLMLLSSLSGDLSFAAAVYLELSRNLIYPFSNTASILLLVIYAAVNGLAYTYHWTPIWGNRRRPAGSRTRVQAGIEVEFVPPETPPPLHIISMQRSRSIPELSCSQADIHSYMSARPSSAPIPLPNRFLPC